MKKIKKAILIVLSIFIGLILVLTIYASNPYEPLEEMSDQIESLDTSTVEVHRDFDEISYKVTDPIANIVFIPGGKVKPQSYEYLAINLALAGYNVTISKQLYNLAILSANYAKRFLSEDLDNIIIGHSLGGVVASMIASDNDLISKVVLLGSYPIRDITDKDVLIVTAEFDIAMDEEAFDDSMKYLNDDAIIYDIEGGNHAQFGWYGPQKGDGTAEMDTLTQQNIVIAKILEFIA